MEKQVAIIGAGISGILACKSVLEKGFRPIVFESRSGLGGVWAKTIASTKLQSPKTYFEFSDFPWPESIKTDYPCQQQVLEYFESYADHFDLIRYIKFNTMVMSIEYEGPSDEEMDLWSLWGGNGEPFSRGGKWKIEVEDTTTLSTQSYSVDFLILATGMFSDVPNIPEFPADKDPSKFHGKVVHSKDYAAMDHEMAAKFIEGKKVAVVGFHKSAIDIALECATANGTENPCTLLYKTEHWNVPDHRPWGINIADISLNRFSENLFHKPGEGYLASIYATLATPLRIAFSKWVEADILRKIPLMVKHGMVPKHSFIEELATCSIALMPMNFYDKVEEGSLKLKKAVKFGFCKEGVIVESDPKPIETDLVILATGFRGDQKLRDIFTSKTFRNYMNNGTARTTIPLYRGVIHPRIPQLAMIGYSESVGNLYTSEMRSRWVAELLDGTFKPPSIEKMEETMVNWDEYMTRYYGSFYRRSCFMLLHINHNDILCKDMGWNPKRKKGFFRELFEAYRPTDYASR